MRVRRLEESDEAEYEDLVRKSSEGMLSHSWRYRALLRRVTAKSEATYLGAYVGKKLIASVSGFLKKGSRFSVINSLPLSGSPGGCITDPSLSSSAATETRNGILLELFRLAESEDCLSSTVITSPFDNNQSYYDAIWPADYVEDRVAQVLFLPRNVESLLACFNKKCRNAVRKAEKSGVAIEDDLSPSSLDYLKQNHISQMKEIGATPKPEGFFNNIDQFFKRGYDYRIYRARIGEEAAALLLVFYYKECVEYFTPVTLTPYRAYSPMNLLIYTVARDAIREGYTRISFGGTRKSQANLYRFKRSFGCSDFPYRYLVRRAMATGKLGDIKEISQESIEMEFPLFYVFPFSRLSQLG